MVCVQPSRSCVYQVIMENGIILPLTTSLRVKEKLPTISFATVYNCLETLVGCGLVKQVNLDRSPARYCPNLQPHAHFKCMESGEIHDLPISEENLEAFEIHFAQRFDAQQFDLHFPENRPPTTNHKLNSEFLKNRKFVCVHRRKTNTQPT